MDKKPGELTQEQLYERIVYKIRKKYNGAISTDESHAAARNAVGFTQTLIEIQSGKYDSKKSV